MLEKDFTSSEDNRKFQYVITTPKAELEILLGINFNYGLYYQKKLLAYIRAIEDGDSMHITHWSTYLEGRSYACVLLREFMLSAIKKYSRVWTYVCKENTTCLVLLRRIADRLPPQYLKSFEDQKNGLILVELKA